MQNLGIESLGKTVACPKCRSLGKLAVDRFRAKGRVYLYLVVRHFAGAKLVKRCVLRRLAAEEAAKLAKPAVLHVEETAKLAARVRELEEENRRLREELERLRSWAVAAKRSALVLTQVHFAALHAYAIRKKGFTSEQAQVAREVLHAICERGSEAGVATVLFTQLPF